MGRFAIIPAPYMHSGGAGLGLKVDNQTLALDSLHLTTTGPAG